MEKLKKRKLKIIAIFTALFIIGATFSFYFYHVWISQQLQSTSIYSIQHLENEIIPPGTAHQLMESNLPAVAAQMHTQPNETLQPLLTTIQTVLNASIVYVMNTEGKVIASTIFGNNESLLNNSYPFRPYFTKAMAGEKTVYEAKGVTTQEKGIYYSSPIHDKSSASIVGVLVIKLSMEKIDYWLKEFDDISLLVNPDGIIFSTNVRQWLYQSIKPLSAETLTRITETQTVGDERISSLPISFDSASITIGKNRYLVKRNPIILNDWELITLKKYDLRIPTILSFFLLIFCVITAFNLIYFLQLREKTKKQLAELDKKERDLINTAQKFVAIYESAVDAVMILRNDEFINCNQHTLKLFKASKEQFIGKKPYELSPQKQADGRDSKEKAKEMITKALQGENQLFEWQHQKTTGEVFDAQISLNPFWENEQIYILAIVRDVTEQKQTQSMLASSKHALEKMIDSIPAGIILIDENQQIRKVNQSALLLTKYDNEDELIGHQCSMIFCSKPDKVCPLKNETETLENAERSLITKAGEIIPVRKNVLPLEIDGETLFLEFVVDIREEKKNELVQKTLFEIANAVNTTSNLHELFQSIQVSLQQIMDSKNFFIALYDRESDTISLPYQKDEKEEVESFPAGKTCTAYVLKTGKSLLATEQDYNKLLESGEVEQFGPKAKVVLMSPLFVDNEVIGVVTVQSYENENQYSERDRHILEFVSDEIATAIKKKQIEEEKQVEKAYFEQLFEASPEAIVICSTDGIVQKVNHTFTKLFYYTEEEAAGQSITSLLSENPSHQTAEARGEQGELAETETIRYRKDGSAISVSILQKPIEILGGQHAVYGIYRDISDKKADELEIESQKEHLQLINKILRHDLMNHLSVINSALKLFKRSKEENYINSAFQAIQSSTELIKKMREMEDFIARHNNLRIYDVKDLINRHVGQSGKLAIKQEAKGKILADESVESVINNIISNAKMHAKATSLHIYSETNHDKLLIHFADNGKGIPAKIKANLFDEHFHYGKTGNTGLGLYIVQKAMHSFGGNVYIEDNQPKGAIFTLIFRTAQIAGNKE